ncbi:MAG TPA: glycosyltransferase [Candidatus Paceibacterota bacterium]
MPTIFNKKPRVALLHDYLNQYGGAERVLETFIELFPDAPIYTLFYDKELMGGRFNNKIIKTSFLDKKIIRRNHRFFIPLMPKAAESIDLGDNYDFIISDSAGWSKGINYKNAVHINYLHCPLRYAWEPKRYLDTLIPEYLIKSAGPIIKYLRDWDKETGLKPDILITPSKFTAEKVGRFYNRDTKILHPPIDTDIFFYEPSIEEKIEPYFLTFGRIVHQKRFDLLVSAFNKLDVKLKIVGSGLDIKNIERIKSSPGIDLLNWVEDNELRKLISGAKATIFAQIEDFGMVAAESIACGTPVIAFNEGGFKEIIKEGENGIFFNEQKEESIIDALKKFEKTKFDREAVASSSKQFHKKTFIKDFKKILSDAGLYI